MLKKTHNEIIDEIKNTETLTAIEIIKNHKNPNQCSIIINDELFSTPYETIYSFDLLQQIKNTVTDNILVIMFNDDELPLAWKQAYENADILKKYPDDRRLKFHQYNEMNEQFCIDRTLLWDITDEFKGTDHEITEDKCKWRFEIIRWYKSHLI